MNAPDGWAWCGGEMVRREGDATMRVWRHPHRWNWLVEWRRDDGSLRCSIESWLTLESAESACECCERAYTRQAYLVNRLDSRPSHPLPSPP